LLQDEPAGTKTCSRCGGGLEFEQGLPNGQKPAYIQAQLELDQVAAPAGQNVERYVLLTISAPKQVPETEAAPPGKPRPPLTFTAVLDVSGSMQGEKINQAKEAVRQSLRCLRPGDVFSLVTFASEVRQPVKPTVIDSRSVEAAVEALEKIQAGGMTALSGGLERGIKDALRQKQDNTLVLLLSDGQANVGETDLEKVGQQGWQARQKGLVVSTLGVGDDYNEALMAEIATQGGGRFYHIDSANMIPAFLAGELGEVAALAGRDMTATLNVPAGATVVPLSAAYPVEQKGGQAVVKIGDVPCETELEIPLRLALLAQAEGTKLSLDGGLEFRSPAGNLWKSPLNRVTVRFKKSAGYQIQEGIVMPVAERVFTQLKAASVLGFSRSRALRPETAEAQSNLIMDQLNQYAVLLGKDRAEQEIDMVRDQMAAFIASPAAAKWAVADAHRKMRSSKDFKNK
jgi:Ca-activated chloride channel family protein